MHGINTLFKGGWEDKIFCKSSSFFFTTGQQDNRTPFFTHKKKTIRLFVSSSSLPLFSVFFGMHSFDGDFLTAEDLSKLFICCQRMYALDADWITEGSFSSSSLDLFFFCRPILLADVCFFGLAAQRVVAGIEDINFSKLRDLVQEAEPLKAALDRRYVRPFSFFFSFLCFFSLRGSWALEGLSTY